jgi:rhodanese-related sulfurtransferase/catechol 2,3-dioxygenase-like lactoylglutathione lyase family enzyme
MAIKPIFGVVDELKAQLENLSIEALKREMQERDDLLLVDIREIQETIDLGTIPGAVHAPRGMLEFWADPASPYYRDFFSEDKRIVVFCAGGGRSAFAAKALVDMGYPDVAHLEAGFNGWKKAGEPVQDVARTSRWMRKPDATKDERPPMWIGHTLLAVTDISASKAFFLKLGLRLVEAHERVAILELRGGTHLILVPADKTAKGHGRAPFDLMVDDIDATHAGLIASGLRPSAIESGDIHRSFSITEPGGHSITVNSTHVTGLPV